LQNKAIEFSFFKTVCSARKGEEMKDDISEFADATRLDGYQSARTAALSVTLTIQLMLQTDTWCSALISNVPNITLTEVHSLRKGCNGQMGRI
jgi:hypothetical protein